MAGTVIADVLKPEAGNELEIYNAKFLGTNPFTSDTNPGVVGGRLTLTSAVPVTTSDVLAAATIYYTPFKGNRIALHNGTDSWSYHTFAETSLSIAALTADTNYDVFAYDNSGTLALETVAWTDDTTRATAPLWVDGVLCKSGDTTRRYLGMIRTTGTLGQCEDSESHRYVWNNDNRVSRYLRLQWGYDWSYGTSTWRKHNNTDSDSKLYFILGQGHHVHAINTIKGSYSNTTIGAGLKLDVDTGQPDDYVYAHINSVSHGRTFSITMNQNVSAGYHYICGMEIAFGTTNFGNGSQDGTSINVTMEM